MKHRVIILPVEVNAQGEPLDPALYEHYKAFCEREFKAVPAPRRTVKTWGAFIPREEGGFESCIGILALQWQTVCPTFHVRKPLERNDIPAAHAARDELIGRAKGFIQDNGGGALPVHVYCAPEMRDVWKDFLESLGAKDANLVTIDAV